MVSGTKYILNFIIVLILSFNVSNASVIDVSSDISSGIDSVCNSVMDDMVNMDSLCVCEDICADTLECTSYSIMVPSDSTLSLSSSDDKIWNDNQFLHRTYLGAATISLGLIEKIYDKKTRNLRNGFLPRFENHTDNYLQVAPVFVLYGMKAAGVKSRSNWGRMIVSDALTVAIMFPLTRGLKTIVAEQRPDSPAKTSFPSGHTTTAFMTATMLHKEYGYISPWITVGAYSCATATGIMRMANNRHWYSDVLVGSGIGILTAEAGYWLADLMFGDHGLNVDTRRKYKFDIDCKPSFISYYTAINIPFNSLYVKSTGKSYSLSSGQSFGMEGAYYLSPYIGIGGKASVLNLAINVENDHELLNSVKFSQFMGGTYFNFPVTERFSLGTKLIGGLIYRKHTDTDELSFSPNRGVCVNTEFALKYRLDYHFSTHFSVNHNFISPGKDICDTWINMVSLGGNLVYQF